MRTLIATAALAALSLAAGCSGGNTRAMPRTYPVTGQVLDADNKPLANALVQFVPITNEDGVTTNGRTGADGKFQLSTLVESKKVDGAIEGPHRVTVLPPMTQDQQGAPGPPPAPVQLSEAYVVKASGENHFTIKLPRGR
jgi:hypothetical protein